MQDISTSTTAISLCGTLTTAQSQRGKTMPKLRMKSALKSYALRLPDELYSTIEQIANAEIRPVNSQMLVFLKRGVEQWRAEHMKPALQAIDTDDAS